MKRLTILLLVLTVVLLSACASSTPAPATQSAASGSTQGLVVSGGATSKSFTRADLEAMPAVQSAFKNVTYKGVTVTELVKAAGFDPAGVKAVKAVASDGFTINYDTSQVLAPDVIVAYATDSGELTAADGAFRMVLPKAEGKLNVRMLTELQVIQ